MSTGNINSFNNVNSFNSVSNNIILTAADDESKILSWLSPLEPHVRHHDICNQRVGSIGNWLLEIEEFRSWYKGSEKGESDHAALLCYGDPGIGKSYIWYERRSVVNEQWTLLLTGRDGSSVVIDYLCDQAMEQNMAVACFYYDFASREAQTPTNMLGSLVKQLLTGLGEVPGEIVQEFRSRKKVIGGRKLQLPDLVNMFTRVSALQRTFLCVDALDECLPEHQLEVLDALEQILERSPEVRVFMTGRSHIQLVVGRGLGGRATSVPIKPRDGDMVTYLRTKLRKDMTPEAMDSLLENDIINSIPGDVSETFLLVSLKVETILRETTLYRRRNMFNAMKDGLGLGDAYAATLERIRIQGGAKAKLAMATLMWVCHSERPLRVEELCHALAVEIGSPNFNNDNVPAAETLLACCQGLIVIDKEASTFRLVHLTLSDHLSTDHNLFPRAHLAMAETCLTYLDSTRVKPQPDLSSLPFLRYCCRYWHTHVNRGTSDCTIGNEGHRPTTGDSVGGPLEIEELVPRWRPMVGGIFRTGKPKSSLRGIDRIRLNRADGPNNRKRYPWIVVEEFPGGKVRVMSSTTLGYKGWDAVSEEYQRFFLPISPTVSNGRPVLNVGADFDGIFQGKSLLYLCVEVDILASVLKAETCMGYLEPSAVEMILRERKLVREAEIAVGAGRGQVNMNGS